MAGEKCGLRPTRVRHAYARAEQLRLKRMRALGFQNEGAAHRYKVQPSSPPSMQA